MNDHDRWFLYIFAAVLVAGLATWGVVIWAAVQVVRHLTGGS
jgi:hypothetical protein